MIKGFHPEYAVDGDHNKKSVLLPIREWDQIVNVSAHPTLLI
uniref:Uncharacterized protein n=1 Tax=Candidatus Kentrum sp. UNK TaxID=2126344 RepID=A0A451ABK7_9GAMM|nr:MAG: hypothetical protein BECKUNK1418G_GA0071005_103319 [Candidatus Kentron sp. UNK]VFK71648.1 MAG: hypothetical protein BECKUNK1418H_GA0071006_10764 [Candidatus Kentron sp. UNK]